MQLPYKLGGVVVLIEMGLLASFTLAWPSREFSVGSISFVLSGRTLLSLVLVMLAWTGTGLVVRVHRETSAGQPGATVWCCVIPGLLIAAAPTLLARLQTAQAQMMGLVGTGVLLGLLIALECYQSRWTDWSQDAVHRFLQLTAYMVAMLACVAVRLSDLPALPSALGVACTGALVALKVLGVSSPSGSQRLSVTRRAVVIAERLLLHRWLRAFAVGLALGILSWPLLRWADSPLSFAAVLTVSLYVLVEILQHFLSGRLTQRLALEYLLVGLIALVMLLSLAP